MSGSIGQGARALFANAPVLPAAPTLPTVPAGSNLASAMMQNNRPMNLQTPQTNIPLASMMAMANRPVNPTPGNNQSSLWFDQNGQLQGTPGQPPPAPQPQTLSWASDVPQQQQAPMQGAGPGMPGGAAPGMPSMGAVGMPSGPAPGTPAMGAPGTPSAGQPGLFGQTMNWLQSIDGGGGSG